MSEIPDLVVRFLQDNGVSLNELLAAIRTPPPRSFHVRGGVDVDMVLQQLQTELACELIPAPFPANFYLLSKDIAVAHTTPYQQAQILSLDASSGVAVAVLDVQTGHDCLDICAAPGMKLVLMADLAGVNGSVTGVDISSERLASCRTIVEKYHLPRVRLFLADGRTFDVEAPPECSKGSLETASRLMKSQLATLNEADLAKNMPFFASRIFRNRWAKTGRLYDRVLVDAECTHDGSVRHLIKSINEGWHHFIEKSLDPERLLALPSLQSGLLRQGFMLLKPGGILVYSTCSLSRAQNEDIISGFLAEESTAILLPASTPDLNLPEACCIPFTSANTGSKALSFPPPHVLRLDPVRSGTSGLFVAKISKLV